MTDEQLSALLRVKRHETPPPGYFDQLLADIHRRQRAELLQRPLWKIALERFQTFFGEHSMSPLSYAGAVASVIIAGGLTMAVINGEGGKFGSATVASAHLGEGQTIAVAAADPTPAPFQMRQLQLAENIPSGTSRMSHSAQVRHVPRYVIDARPVSYDRPFSF